MRRELRRHQRRQNDAAILDHSGRGLIARTLDSKDAHCYRGELDLSEFNYHLPESSIAQQPLADRAASRMLVLYRAGERWEDRSFRDFPQFLRPGDCLVLNDSKVFPSRLFGHRAGVHSLPVGKNNPKLRENLSGKVEVFLLQPVSDDSKTWTALVHPGRKMRVGGTAKIDNVTLRVEEILPEGERVVSLDRDVDLYAGGLMPLPPYIGRASDVGDNVRYQTVFARSPGALAAPTAGLHFTQQILSKIPHAFITLHIGIGTFLPVRAENLAEHRMHAERFCISSEAANKINNAGRIVAVGTTTVRTLESAKSKNDRLLAQEGSTDLFIYPPYRFQVADLLLTNFHLPRSTLLMLVSAFAGREFLLRAYQEAIREGYRFYSYGDCMLIL